MAPWLALVLLCMSTYRVTRFVTRDVFPPVRWAREMIERRLGEEHWLAYLTQCDWCASIYVAAGLTTGLALADEHVMHTLGWDWPLWIGVGLTASAVTGLIAQSEPSEE